jgi:hypothetical protein
MDAGLPVATAGGKLKADTADRDYFGRMASAVPWMKALILSTSSAVSLPLKSGMPRSASESDSTYCCRLPITPAEE